MSATLAAGVRAAAPAGVSQRRVLHSEWTKLRSLRSNRILVALSVVLMIAFGILIALITAHQWPTMSARSRADFNLVDTAGSGGFFVQLSLGIFGVLAMSSEYSTGMIRSTLAAVPTRLPVLWAKLGIVSTVAFLTTLISFAIALEGTKIAMGDRIGAFSFSDGTILRALFGGAFFLAAIAALGVAAGAILRSTAGGISAIVGFFFVLPLVSLALPAVVMNRASGYLPSNAGQALFSTTSDTSLLSPLAALCVLCGYLAVAVGTAAFMFARRDA